MKNIYSKIDYFIQLLHYEVYKFNVFTTKYVFGLPVRLLLMNKWVIKQYNKRGVKNPLKTVDYAITNPKFGTDIILSNAFICIMLIMIEFSLINVLSGILKYVIPLEYKWEPIAFLLILIPIPFFLTYYVIDRHDRYLAFFKEFEKLPRKQRIKNGIICFITIVIIFGLTLFSFFWMSYMINGEWDSIGESSKEIKEKKIFEIMNKMEDSLYQGHADDSINEEIELKLEKIEDSLYKVKGVK